MKIDHIEDSQDHIGDIVFTETNLKKILPNHILIVVRGMILAHSFPVAINAVSIAINQDMKAIELSEDINSRYLFSCLKALKQRILSVVSSAGHGTKRLDLKDAEAILIPLPEIELQEKFSLIYNHIYSQKKIFEKQYASLQKLNSSLQTKFFQ